MRNSILNNREAVVSAAKTSNSISEALICLGLRPAGGNFEAFKRACVNFEVKIPIFDRAKQLSSIRNETPLDEILVEDSSYSNNQSLLKKLVKAELLEYLCVSCGLGPEWNGKPITLQLDHINGDAKDNRLINLRILCPNCHSQTDTFCGKKQPNRCDCGVTILASSSHCRACSNKIKNKDNERIDWPSSAELRERLRSSNYSALSRELNISDNAIRKRLKNHP